jgi:hypothetical protein
VQHASNALPSRLHVACSSGAGAGRQGDFGFVPGYLVVRNRYFPCPTAQSQPPAVAR